jgi:hypothetical protein
VTGLKKWMIGVAVAGTTAGAGVALAAAPSAARPQGQATIGLTAERHSSVTESDGGSVDSLVAEAAQLHETIVSLETQVADESKLLGTETTGSTAGTGSAPVQRMAGPSGSPMSQGSEAGRLAAEQQQLSAEAAALAAEQSGLASERNQLADEQGKLEAEAQQLAAEEKQFAAAAGTAAPAPPTTAPAGTTSPTTQPGSSDGGADH